MEWYWALLLIIGLLVVLMAIGLHIAFAMMLTAAIGSYIWWGGLGGLSQLVISLAESLTTFVLLPVPLFILMGELLFHSEISSDVLDAVDSWLGRLPGRLSMTAVATGAILSTLTGVGTATIAILGKELVPEMEKRGYKPSMTIGPVLGSSGLAVMIPPSGLAVLLAAIGQFSVGKLLLGIIVPGLLMATLYVTYIVVRCHLQPSIAPPYTPPPTKLVKKVINTVKYVLPIGLVIFLVTGVIFMGIATPSEAAATGVLGVVILIALYGNINRKVIKKALYGTAKISVMILLIIASAMSFSRILAFSGASRGLLEFVTNLPIDPFAMIICILMVMMIAGMFMPVLGILIVVLPMMIPIIIALGFSPIWFGTMMLLTLEMAVVSPPYGVDLFVMKQVAPTHITLGEVYRSSLPFLCCDIVALALILLFPSIVLWLPGLAR